MATQSNSKRQKYTVIDRISALPDSLLCQILSLLPTKQAVVTTTLSTRWQPLWTMVPAFDFDDTEIQNQDYGNESMAITHFVCGFFTLRKPVPLKKFRLHLYNSSVYDPILVHTWICYAIGHDLEELDLFLIRSHTFELPPSLFSCESLKILSLNGKIPLNCPSSVHLPNLEILRLIEIKYANDDSVRRLLTGCPNLIMFYIGRTQRDNVITLLCLPRLKWFHIRDECQDHEFEIEMNASGCKNLYLYDLDFQNYLLVNTTNVVEATIRDLSERSEQDGQENYSQCILKLLRALPNLHTLILRYIKSLSVASTYDLPYFNNLRRIKLTVRCCKWHLLPYLLERAQNLEDFVLVKVSKA
ncbi:hypothetical protein SO802_022389 [Lithocarpus litseifolius]|uniref:F-box domain-containing protein n=1 Tax=Lithocarpus litseifolius TaxID=425828 RepID=A0AAW2CHZ4_9ROSI